LAQQDWNATNVEIEIVKTKIAPFTRSELSQNLTSLDQKETRNGEDTSHGTRELVSGSTGSRSGSGCAGLGGLSSDNDASGLDERSRGAGDL
jgi:hypothetical protein